MKRAVAIGSKAEASSELNTLARESALRLLERSIAFGHGRLAVIRLSLAAMTGADITPAHWAHCEAAALRSRDLDLQALLTRARAIALSGAESVPAD